MKNKFIKKYLVGFGIILLSDIIFALLFYFIGRRLFRIGGVEMILLIYLGGCLITLITFVKNKLVVCSRAVKKESIKCQVYDFIITSVVEDHRRRYEANILFKDSSGKLYFSYGRFALNDLRSIRIQNHNKITSINVLRSDGTPVKVGDTAYLYIDKVLDDDYDISTVKNRQVQEDTYCNRNICNLANVKLFRGVFDMKNEEET